ncbi:hypothetical protein Q5M85_03530 [Paraclostridium bifermentans]|nr:hypothetical protein [Paraclostridium bifermentans]
MIESYYKNDKNSYYLIDKAYRKFYVARQNRKQRYTVQLNGEGGRRYLILIGI